MYVNFIMGLRIDSLFATESLIYSLISVMDIHIYSQKYKFVFY